MVLFKNNNKFRLSPPVRHDAVLFLRNRRSRERARSMVCARCWRELVDTPEYGHFCKFPDTSIHYKTSLVQVCESARLGCSWCKLIETSIRRQWGDDVEEQEQIKLRMWNTRNPPSHKSRKHNTNYIIMEGEQLDRTLDVQFLAYTRAEDIAAAHVRARPAQLDVGIETIEDQVHSWLATCSTHESCAKREDRLLPTRLIYVSPSEDPDCARLIHSSGLEGGYATLSYCWGAPSSTILGSATYEEYHARLPWSIMPQTVKDAILVTRAANLRYLWVDAFCIVQDSESDKIREIARMCDIYRNSVLTIVAASAKGASEGFLQQRIYPGPTFTVPFRVSHGSYGTACLEYEADHHDWTQSDPIQARAWTLQEQVLAQRILYFGARTLDWRCGAGRQDLKPDAVCIPPKDVTFFEHEGQLLTRMHAISPTNPYAILDFWKVLVTNYCPRQTTVKSDRLKAIAGIAQVLPERIGPGYYAGLWEWNFASQLCWKRTSGTPGSRNREYCAPSWSWASCTGRYVRGAVRTPDVEILHVECTPVNDELPYGAVKDGFMLVTGRYARANWSHSGNYDERFVLDFHEGIDPRGGREGDECEVKGKETFQEIVFVILDAVEDEVPTAAVCLRISSDAEYYDGLVLEPVPAQPDTFRRIGYFTGDRKEGTEKLWRVAKFRVI